MTTQNEKAAAFRALHEQDEAFVIPNPWDAGTARMLAGLGFEALATTSAPSVGFSSMGLKICSTSEPRSCASSVMRTPTSANICCST